MRLSRHKPISYAVSLAIALTPILPEFARAQARGQPQNAAPAPAPATAPTAGPSNSTAEPTADPSASGRTTPPATSSAATGEITRADYEDCRARDEKDFQSAIEKITLKSLRLGLETVDYDGLVGEHWRKVGMDTILDKRVDLAVAEIRKETSWGNLLKSLAYREQAQKLATDVAERVYRSDAVKSALEQVVIGVGSDVGRTIDFASQDAAEPALKCVRAFLGPRYGRTIADAVTSDAGAGLQVEQDSGSASITSTSVLKEASGGLTGAALLLVRRQLANLARTVGQRLVGSILSRLVSVVAGGIGLVLIAKDIWDLRHGVLPIIASEMKSNATKQQVRAEIAKALSEQISQQVEGIASQSAQKVISVWREFRSAHSRSLKLAERNEDFRAFLDNIVPRQLPRLDEVIALTLQTENETGILNRLRNGTLSEAVKETPAAAIQIAREERSLDTGLEWNRLAGADIDAVVDYGLYRIASPGDFTRPQLRRVIELSDPLAVPRLAALDQVARTTLFTLPDAKLSTLARALTTEELAQLADYLEGLAEEPRSRILQAVAETPSRMQFLASSRVRSAVVASNDQLAAVEMMLRPGSAFDLEATYRDFNLAWEGKVSPYLIVEKHPVALVLLAIAILISLLILRRLFVSPAGKRKTSNRTEGDVGTNQKKVSGKNLGSSEGPTS